MSATRRFFRRTTVTIVGAGFLVGGGVTEPAFARHHHGPHRARIRTAHRVFGSIRPAHRLSVGYTPPFSAYAVDGNSGRVLYGRDENALRHPASITKVMTLYLLFDEIQKGHLSLDSRIVVSPHAASQAPTKLGLRAGSTIRVEDAIYSIVTKSANDMAVAIAERIGGDEPAFARMMTRRAHALGMSRTTYVNASGLPDDRQLTTAKDVATLGRAIHDHFPRYFHYFSTPSFRYAGRFMPNHNHLMEQVQGMDGIKTGYTRLSGFNLLSSVNRNGHWLVSVVLGGKTRLGRDRIMADLIAADIDKCATRRTAPMVAENPALDQVAEAIPVVQHEGDAAPPVEGIDDESAAEQAPAPLPEPEIRQARVETPPPSEIGGGDEMEPPPTPETYAETAPAPKTARPIRVRVAAIAPSVRPRPRPAFVSGVPRPPERDMITTGSIRSRRSQVDGSSSRYVGAATATPSAFRHGPRRDRAEAKAKPIRVAMVEAPAPAQHPSHGGYIIQIGATPDLAQANSLLARAKGKARVLGSARPFTEKVKKGRETLYRARFAGLDSSGADSACKALKRAGIACFSAKN